MSRTSDARGDFLRKRGDLLRVADAIISGRGLTEVEVQALAVECLARAQAETITHALFQLWLADRARDEGHYWYGALEMEGVVGMLS